MKYAIKLSFNDDDVLTQADPYEIVRLISDKTMEIRSMWISRDASKPVPPECRSNMKDWKGQSWDVRSDPDYSVIRIRKHKDGEWYSSLNYWFRFSDEPVCFFNFDPPAILRGFKS